MPCAARFQLLVAAIATARRLLVAELSTVRAALAEPWRIGPGQKGRP